jgi:hypothetical protein
MRGAEAYSEAGGCWGTATWSGDNMTQARRARGLARRRRGAWLLIAVPLVLLVAGMLIFLGISRQPDLGRLPISPSSAASASTTAGSPTPSSQPSRQPTPSEDSGAAVALRACRAKVAAADEVLAAAEDGMQNWSDHVQAQTDANAGKITVAEMGDIFDRTMKAGDKDEKRYKAAVKSYKDRDGSCSEVQGASPQVTRRLARCAERKRAQEPVLEAAKDGMSDWITHLGDMRRSAQGKIHNPQQKWLRTWRAAPKNINAYDAAVDKFSARDC